jgi:DNA-binding response OmpR family regulator
MKILIAEDQPASATFLRRTLDRMGHEVAVATDGAAAWQALRDNHAPALISDWKMPRLDGLELCRKIRALGGHSYTYVILLRAKVRREDRLEGLRAGADDFLAKPVDADELALRLESASRILAVHEALAWIFHPPFGRHHIAIRFYIRGALWHLPPTPRALSP